MPTVLLAGPYRLFFASSASWSKNIATSSWSVGMNTSAVEIQEPRAQDLKITEDNLVVELVDGRTLTVPLAWFPRLWYGSEEERARFEIIGDGCYLHWPDLD